MTPTARLRRFYWRHVRRYHYEICHACGRPIRLVWQTPNYVWERLMGGSGGLLCPSCFTRKMAATGEPVRWEANVGCCDFAPHGDEHPCGRGERKLCWHCGDPEPCEDCWQPITPAMFKGLAAEAGVSVEVVGDDFAVNDWRAHP